MSHEKGIEAAAKKHAQLRSGREVGDIYSIDAENSRSIIAAYLAEAQPTSEGEERLMPTEKRLVRRLMQTLNIETCRDHSCMYTTEPIKGMGTNGGCRCASNVESAVFDLARSAREGGKR